MNEVFLAILLFLGGSLLLKEWWRSNERKASTEAEHVLDEVFEMHGIDDEDEDEDEEKGRLGIKSLLNDIVKNFASELRNHPILDEEGRGLLADINRKLVLAGSPRNWTAAEALAATLLAWSGTAVVMVVMVFGMEFPRELAAIVMACVFLYPPLWLRSARIARQDAARFELLDFTNDLRQNVSGNATLADAIGRIVREDPEGEKERILVKEFGRAYREYRLGNRDLDEALLAAARRLDVPSVNDFVDAIVQTRRTGAPIGEVLQSQYNQALVLYDEDLQTMIAKKVVPMTISLAIVMCGALVWLVGPLILEALIDISAA